MSALFWTAKYIEDPFRNEPRNVGVVVSLNGSIASRFIGERDDGSFDARRLGNKFLYPDVYSQWRQYWRKTLRADKVDEIAKKTTPNFYLERGGDVTDVGGDNASDVCVFLYNLLVGGGVINAYEWQEEVENDVTLESDIYSALSELNILHSESSLLAQHPVVKGATVVGQHVVHTPSFSQRNGRLYVMEHIDFNSSRLNSTKQRAGWMAYMFSDIKDNDESAVAYSLIRPEERVGAEQIEYAKSVLSGESRLINWSDDNERNQFLNERARIAQLIPANP